MHTRLAVFLCNTLCGALVTCGMAFADPQPAPTPIVLPTLPANAQLNPYAKAAIDLVTGVARQALQNNGNRAEGEVTYFKRFEMQVRTSPNGYRSVHLHQGTRIDPRGATLQPGDRVSIGGSGQSDGSLDADAITILR